MSGMLPIVEILAGAQTHQERAEWLFSCPYAVMHRDHMAIRRILQRAGLEAGISYLEAVVALACAKRLPDGLFPQTIIMPVQIAAHDLRAAARAGAEGARMTHDTMVRGGER